MRENLVVIPLNSDEPIDSEMRQALEAVNLVKGKKNGITNGIKHKYI